MKTNCQVSPKLTKKEVERLLAFLKVIGEDTRLRIINLLNQDDYCVCDIWRHFKLPQNLVSHHLKVLKDLGLVSSRRVGLNTYYRLEKEKLNSYYFLLSKLLRKEAK